MNLKLDEDDYDPNNCSINVTNNQTVNFDKFAVNSDGIRTNDGQLVIDGVHQDDLRPDRIIGQGACSTVQLMRHVRDGTLYAVKRFNFYDREKRKQLMQEINTLHQMDCQALIEFHGAYTKSSHIYVVLEYMDRGSLTDVIQDYDRLDERYMAAVTYQILWGLGYLHYERRLHRDIKPSNILVNQEGKVKLTDFGIAREVDEDSKMATTMIGTYKYMSPERLKGDAYDSSGDIWSLGIVLIEMVTQRTPFPNVDNQLDMAQELLEMKNEDLIPTGEGCSSELCEFIQACLQRNPADRLSTEQLFKLPWLDEHGIDDLDKAISVYSEWMDNNPPLDGNSNSFGGAKMVSTMESEFPDSDEEDDYKK
uniref:mitogen-activated protein kinase kinase n=1 Tax=Fibrocapsa japonica TaxID=94617 RepID=A0A7S2UX05_9STRA|mmetsp:Transcript_12890/g.19025  ORF Transcript_12890/g.19025 Transcript_12890/m.19025 type:complete len:365 (+) Transcript_12890:73-1167(+)|eukprot:CAMPEP_0113942946 /NCGR_PEP_ID=MMETSP1339-20121228/14973_1 /TAXON_ID=94617 /ORGANISM="Fibrocapsa japonica" /LENGTH=364 /DNA_ID=CAMNT_0000947645 /DNA_START=71 /DNA_END=1165 /DNA_ORIENTATION=- /assembly_acc=CAM_ASM_000762